MCDDAINKYKTFNNKLICICKYLEYLCNKYGITKNS